MLKRIAWFGVIAALAISGSAFASKSGLYFGAGLGYQNVNFKTANIDTGFTANSIVSGDGALGQLFVGYGFSLSNNMWLGLELNGKFGGAKSINTDTNVGFPDDNDSFKIKASYGLSVRPGYFLNKNTKAYAVLGWQRARFENIYAETGLTTQHFKSTSNGFRYGLGMEANLTKQLSLRAEWTQTRFSKQTETATILSQTMTVRPLTNQFTVSAVWTV